MNRRNYQRELEQILAAQEKEGRVPTLLLHSCCAPCSSYTLEYLSQYFSITLFYYNPNISPREEYEKRVAEQRRFISELPTVHPVSFREGEYDPERYFQAVRGLEQEPEGGKRCEVCFRLRLGRAAREARQIGAEYLTTTLTISPLKNAPLLNAVGEEAAREAGVCWLPSDFKKKDGYKRSIELSAKYGLYRQNYCGCVYSRRD